MALLGEMILLTGWIIISKETSHVDDNGLVFSISYAAQTAQLRHQSIKDIIFFGGHAYGPGATRASLLWILLFMSNHSNVRARSQSGVCLFPVVDQYSLILGLHNPRELSLGNKTCINPKVLHIHKPIFVCSESSNTWGNLTSYSEYPVQFLSWISSAYSFDLIKICLWW